MEDDILCQLIGEEIYGNNLNKNEITCAIANIIAVHMLTAARKDHTLAIFGSLKGEFIWTK